MKKRIIASICLIALSLGSLVQPVVALENDMQEETVVDTTNKEPMLQSDSMLQFENEDENSEVNEEVNATLYEMNVLATVTEESHQPEVNAEVTEKGNGKFSLKITGVEQFSDVEKVYAPTWSLDNQQNIYWYTANKQLDGTYEVNVDLANHQNLLGEYTSHIYLVKTDGSMNHVESVKFSATLNGGWIETSLQNRNSSVRVDWKNLDTQGIDADILFAVWGEENGQDDLHWYTASEFEDSYYADIWLYDHNDIGNYNVHAYVQDTDGGMYHLASTYFYIESMPEETMFEITNVDNTQGRFTVNLYVNNTKRDVSKVYIPVWSSSDQSDLIWYTADKTSNGKYSVTVDIDDHKCNTGVYQVHAYIQDSKGNQRIVGETKVAMNISAGEFIVSNSDDYFVHISVDSLVTQGIEAKVYFAAWSRQSGQDDLVWYEARKSNGIYSADLSLYNHNDAGIYELHAYIQDKNGNMHLLKEATFNVESIPEESKIEVVKTDNQKGTFVVDVYLRRSEQSAVKVYVPVWSKRDQSDLCWYEASKVSDGHYSVKIDIADHDYNLGTYYIHLYTLNRSLQLSLLNTMEHIVTTEFGEFYEEYTGSQYSTKLVLDPLAGQGTIDKVYFAVWGETNGQNDLKWYVSESYKTGYSAQVNYFDHNETGTYQAHAYILGKNGNMTLLKEITFEVDKLPEESLTVSNVKPDEGLFDVTVVVGRPSDTIKRVYVPIWIKEDQSDLFWYTADLQDDGSYKVTIDALDHYWKCGNYNIHAYVLLNDGSQQFVKAETVDIQLGTKIVTEKANLCSYRVMIYGMKADVTKMDFAAWSVENGQDDLVWYEGEKDENGNWSALIHSKHHNAVGDYECHIYDASNGNVLFDKVTFNIEKNWSNEWVWIDGYKRYINANGDIDTDVSRLVTGPYMIKVYKWSNYLTIFAKDEHGNYTVPVKAMITSCGNATPVGTFYTPARFRWCTMIKNSEAQWVTQVVGDYLLHSVPYDRRDPRTLRVTTMYNWLGTTQSSGCIRLTAGDAKWIYDNCSLGTRVVITASESGGPIEKPSFEPIPDWHTWDPTDPNMQYLCEQKGCH